MKNIFLVILIFVALFLGCKSRSENVREDVNECVTSIKEDFQYLRIRPQDKLWISMLPTKVDFIKRRLPQLKGKTVHVILQCHDSPYGLHTMRAWEIAQVDKCQRRVYHFLNQIKPKLLVIEGLVDDQLNMIPGFMSEEKRYRVLEYSRKNPKPNCYSIGGEPDGVYELGFRFMFNNLSDGFDATVALRSYYHIARIAYWIERENVPPPYVIVIGAFHKREYLKVAKDYQIKIIYHDATK
jgi:hypothetical protein